MHSIAKGILDTSWAWKNNPELPISFLCSMLINEEVVMKAY